jgi:hypothetical protein
MPDAGADASTSTAAIMRRTRGVSSDPATSWTLDVSRFWDSDREITCTAQAMQRGTP